MLSVFRAIPVSLLSKYIKLFKKKHLQFKICLIIASCKKPIHVIMGDAEQIICKGLGVLHAYIDVRCLLFLITCHL